MIVPTSCTSVGSYAFEKLALITNIVVSDTVTSIGEGAFQGCSALRNITLPFIGLSETATDVYQKVFGYIFGCTGSGYSGAVTSSTYGYTAQGIVRYSSDYYGYYIPKSIREVTITKQTDIPANAFYNCDLIETITLPENISSIGGYAFYNCKSLNKLNGTEIG